jgi:diguanylate cyclase (GGDEF)-like protein
MIGDLRDDLESLSKILQEEGYNTLIAAAEAQAIQFVEKEQPDLILIDSLNLYNQLKVHWQYVELLIVFLINHDQVELVFEICEEETFDYLIKPFNRLEILARIRLNLELNTLRNQVEELLYNNQKLTRKLELFANRDELTHILNRRYFLSLAYQELHRTRRYNRCFGILILDLDHFKDINELYGHALGDQVLQAIAKNVSQCLRTNDLLGRFGGEEFVVLLPETDLENSQKVGERICKSIANLEIPIRDELVKVTVSIGISCYHENDSSFEDILKRADQALAEAKATGRNQVITYP